MNASLTEQVKAAQAEVAEALDLLGRACRRVAAESPGGRSAGRSVWLEPV
ncbi:MAG: hypothetical protein H0V09_03700 [Gemmatimonadetes bacterium]|nr:hypothetical protein [Gemmatimonadota bacterium]